MIFTLINETASEAFEEAMTFLNQNYDMRQQIETKIK